MKTLTMTTQSSTTSFGMMPSSTESATALATANWAGPKIFPASSMSLMVTLGTMTVWGFGGRLGLITASRGVCPAERLLRDWAKE